MFGRTACGKPSIRQKTLGLPQLVLRTVGLPHATSLPAAAHCQVRGVDSISTDELSFILDASGACALVAQDARTLQRLLPHLPASVGLLWELLAGRAEISGPQAGRNAGRLPAEGARTSACASSPPACLHNPSYDAALPAARQDSCNFAVELWGDAPAAPSKPSLRVVSASRLVGCQWPPTALDA